MGHTIFWILHVTAVLFGLVLLIVTIPAHLIYSAIKSNRSGKSADPRAMP